MEKRVTGDFIESLSAQERVFYFHDFMYFLEGCLQDKYSGRVESLLEYFTYLLLIFDRILIPAEHIAISQSEMAESFKQAFFNHRLTRSLIESRRIISTIWSSCHDLHEHMEASARYKREVGAADSFKDDLLSGLECLTVFRRDASKQSDQARGRFAEIIDASKWGTELARLRYEDGKVVIPFSHERLLLGDSRGKLSDLLVKKAVEAYIYAMPAGNGRIYRSRIYGLESIEAPISIVIRQEHLISQFSLDPPCLRLLFVGMLKFNRPNENHFTNTQWISWFVGLVETAEARRFREKVCEILHYISQRLATDFEKAAQRDISIVQSRWHSPKLLAAGAKALIERKPGGLIAFLGEYFHEVTQKKYFYLKPHIRDRFNKAWRDV